MLMSVLNIIYVLVAIAMVALILMQRGSGAAAGSGFGAGASGTVFGARGAANFLSKSTKWLAIVFFGISLFMAWYASHAIRPQDQEDLGIISALQEAPPVLGNTLPAVPTIEVGEVPQISISEPATTAIPETISLETITDADNSNSSDVLPFEAEEDGSSIEIEEIEVETEEAVDSQLLFQQSSPP